jgi:hypothetical protein
MKSEYFHCPHCRTQLKKSAAAWVLGEAGGYVAGSPPISCPACRRSLDAQALIDGKYDESAWSEIGTLVFLLLLLIGTPLQMMAGRGFWVSLGSSFAAGLAVVVLLALVGWIVGKVRVAAGGESG